MNQIFVVLIEVCTHGLRILTGFLVNLHRNHDTTPLPRCRCCSGSKVFLPRLLAKLIPLKKLLNRYLLHKVQMISTRKYPLRRYLLDPPGQRKRITHKENITLSGPWQTAEPEWPKWYVFMLHDGRTDGRMDGRMGRRKDRPTLTNSGAGMAKMLH